MKPEKVTNEMLHELKNNVTGYILEIQQTNKMKSKIIAKEALRFKNTNPHYYNGLMFALNLIDKEIYNIVKYDN